MGASGSRFRVSGSSLPFPSRYSVARETQHQNFRLFFVVNGRPDPQRFRGQRIVRPSALEGAKLGVYQAMTEQGIKKAELARRLGWHMPQVDRLFDLRHASRLDQIEAAARVLGRHLEVRVA